MRDARTTGKQGPFGSDEGVERLLLDAGFVEVRTATRWVSVWFDDADQPGVRVAAQGGRPGSPGMR